MLPSCNVTDHPTASFLLLESEDAISNHLRKFGAWSPHLIDITRQLCQDVEAPLIMDIGAHLGGYSIPLAKELLVRGGSVYAYEPQRIIYYQLCGSVILNRLDNYHAHHLALGKAWNGAKVDISEVDYARHNNTGAFALDPEVRERIGVQGFATSRHDRVSIQTLDSIELPRSPVLIKLDVEGMEREVLESGVSFLFRHRFPPILFEAWDLPWFAEERRALMAFLESLGYSVRQVLAEDFLAQHRSRGG